LIGYYSSGDGGKEWRDLAENGVSENNSCYLKI